MMRPFWQSWFSSHPSAKKFDVFIIFLLQRKNEIVQRPWASLRAGLRTLFLSSIESSWLRTSFCANKIWWCNSKVVEKLLLGWIEIIFLFLLTFFFKFIVSCCSKNKEPPLKWGINLWEEMMRPFWQSWFSSLSKRQKFDVFSIFLQWKSEIVQKPWASLRACLRPLLWLLQVVVDSVRHFCANKKFLV